MRVLLWITAFCGLALGLVILCYAVLYGFKW
jgi:hypothetical protein